MPDGRARNGGARAGAGRKPKQKEEQLERLLAKVWKKTDREKVFEKLVQRALAGSMEAIKFLVSYEWGKPAQRVLIEQEGPDESGGNRLDLSQLTKEELTQLETLLAKARRGESGAGAA